MALKTNFEDSSVISSVFVDEIANPGVPGTSNEEVERQAIRVNQLRLAQQAADKALSGDKPAPKPKQATPRNDQERVRSQPGGNARLVKAMLDNK